MVVLAQTRLDESHLSVFMHKHVVSNLSACAISINKAQHALSERVFAQMMFVEPHICMPSHADITESHCNVPISMQYNTFFSQIYELYCIIGTSSKKQGPKSHTNKQQNGAIILMHQPRRVRVKERASRQDGAARRATDEGRRS